MGIKGRIGDALAQWPRKVSRRRPYPFLEKQLREIPLGASVLNIGAGGGYDELVRRVAKERGYEVRSSDIDSERSPDLIDDICASRLEDASVDVIVMADVLEHVQDPFAAASEIRRILKPGGALLLVVPFFFPIHASPHDYFRFTEYGLKHLFARLEIVAFERRDNWLQALLMSAGRIAHERGQAWLALFVIPICSLLYPLASRIGEGPSHITSGYMMKAVRPGSGAESSTS
jgi:SAM-dependent methyltransferase